MNLSTRQIGKWLLEAEANDKVGAVIAITNDAATTVKIWRCGLCITQETVSDLAAYSNIPKYIRRAASGMLCRWEKKFPHPKYIHK